MAEQGRLPQKVLMTADTVGGIWVHALDLSRALSERGIEVALATLGDPLSDAQRETVERIPRLRLFESTLRLERTEEPCRDLLKAGEWLLRLEGRIGPDVVHLNSHALASLPWSAPKLVAVHDFRAAVEGEPALQNLAGLGSCERYRNEVKAGLAAADLVVAATSAQLAALAEHYGPLAHARVIPHGRDGRLFRPSPKEEMVFAAGRLRDEAQNLVALERVAPEIPWPIYVASAAGESQLDGGEIRPHTTRLLGRLSPRAAAAWLGRAAIYALPARHEPFGIAALEAALAGCVLVLGDIPSLREVWRNRAVFVAPDDPAALRTAFLSLIENPERRNALAAAARARALELTPERMLDGYLSAYAELLASREETREEMATDVFRDASEPALRIAV